MPDFMYTQNSKSPDSGDNKMTTKTINRLFLQAKDNPLVLNTASGGYLNVKTNGQTVIKQLNLPKTVSGTVQADGTTGSTAYYCTKSTDIGGVLYSLFVDLPSMPSVVITPMLNASLLANISVLVARFTVIETVTAVTLTSGKPGFRINVRFIKCSIPTSNFSLNLELPDSTTFNFVATTNESVEL